MTSRFLAAVQFLTVWPIRRRTAPLPQAALFFPFIGALLGASAGGIVLVARRITSPSLAALLAIVLLLFLTGCLHEDGLADVADAFRSGRTPEKIMLILKDSRIGTYGGLALVLSVILRWQALAACRLNPAYALAATLALSRASLVVLGSTAPPTGSGLGRAFSAGLNRPTLTVVILFAAAFSFLAGWRYALLLLAASTLVTFAARRYFLRHLGGINGDCLGATSQLVEIVGLLVLACPLSS